MVTVARRASARAFQGQRPTLALGQRRCRRRLDDQHAEARQASQWLLAEYEQTAAALQAWRNGCLVGTAKHKRFLRTLSPGPMLTLKDG